MIEEYDDIEGSDLPFQDVPDPASVISQDRIYLDNSRPVHPLEWVIEGWIPSGRLSLIAGSGGSGKSTFALQLALCVAKGVSFSDDLRVIHRRRVIYFTYEDDYSDIEARRLRIGMSWPREQFTLVDLSGLGPMHQAVYGRLEKLPIANDLESLINDNCGWAIIDSRAASFAGNENARGEVRAFGDWLGAVARRSGAAITLIDHTPKSQSDYYSGSTDWINGARAAISFELARKLDANGQPTNVGDPDNAILTLQKSNLSRLVDPVKLEKSESTSWTWTPATETNYD